MRNFIRIAFAVTVLALCAAPAYAAVIFNFTDFTSCAGLQINGNAACTGGVLRVTPALFGQSGSAFSTTQVPLGAGASFSTFFAFRISASGGISDSDGPGADGIVFALQPVSSTVGGSGGGIGYAGIPTSLGVEFDTYDNGAPCDPNGNHVGVDLNGSVCSVLTATIPARMNDGNIWYAWIDYNGTLLELRLSQTSTRPTAATLSYPVNLATVLGSSQAFVGFTSGTGSAFGNHDILSWEFDNAFNPIGAVPVLPQIPVPTLSEWGLILVALLAAIAGGLAIRGRRALD